MHATKTYTYSTLVKALHTKINKQLLSVTYDFYTEITITTDMQHLQGITHKNTCNYNHIYYKP
jgi:hypothetical protein